MEEVDNIGIKGFKKLSNLFFFFSQLFKHPVREFGSFILIADGDKHETVWNIVSFSFKNITVNKLVCPEALYCNLCN